MYNCGMYYGSFDPLHLGHVRCIIEAATQCENLIIVLSHGILRNEVDIRVRYRWLYRLTSHIGNVNLFVLSDTVECKADYTSEYWAADRKKYSDQIMEIYHQHGFKLEIVNGNYHERFERAVSLVNKLKWGSPTTQCTAPEFRIQESEFRIVVSASRTDLIFLFFVYVTRM